MLKKPEYLIVSLVIASAVVITLGISMAISDVSLFGTTRRIKIQFSSVEGIVENSRVKFAGATIGHVSEIRVLPVPERRISASGEMLLVELSVRLDHSVSLPADLNIDLRREGLLGQMFVAMELGKNLNSEELDYNKTLEGRRPLEVTDIAGPAVRLIDKVEPMMERFGPIAERLEGITTKVDDSLPNLIAGLDAVMDDSNELMSTFNSKESKERFDGLMANLKVVSANLKVVTSNAKALTSTLAHKPWRVVWGGKVDLPPSEEEILRSDRALPTRNEIQVRPSSPRSRTSRSSSASR